MIKINAHNILAFLVGIAIPVCFVGKLAISLIVIAIFINICIIRWQERNFTLPFHWGQAGLLLVILSLAISLSNGLHTERRWES